MQYSRLLLFCVLGITFAFCGEPQPPSKEKIDSFLTKLTECCLKSDIHGIKALSCFDGTQSGLVDQSVGFWETIFDLSRKGRVFKEVKYISLEDELSSPGVNPTAIKWMIAEQTRNGHTYSRNLPTVGFATVTYTTEGEHPNNASNIFPVSIDSEGNLKFSEWKRTDPPASPATLRSNSNNSAPTSTPSQEQIDAFTNALFAALHSGDIEACKALFCFDGIPEELVDQEIDRFKITILDHAKTSQATFEQPRFTPMDVCLANMGAFRKDFEAELQTKLINGKPYRVNLSPVGAVTISIKSPSSTSGSQRFVGLHSSGTLKFIIQGPVEK